MSDTIITKVSVRLGFILATSLLAFLAACSPAQKYKNAVQSSNYFATDVESCADKATALIDRETTQDQSYNREGADPLELSFVEFDARKQRSHYFDNCMSQRGHKRGED